MKTLLEQKKSEVRETIMKSFGYESTEDMLENLDTTTAIRKGIVEFDDELEKAVYADTPQNRKLGRVGQEYHRGGKKQQQDVKQNKTKKQADASNPIHERAKAAVIKDINHNGAGSHDDEFIDNNPTDYYRQIMKKYNVENVGELADKLGSEYEDGYERYGKIYTKMLKQIPAAAFDKEYGH